MLNVLSQPVKICFISFHKKIYLAQRSKIISDFKINSSDMESADLSLDEIVALGGSKHDFEMLKNIESKKNKKNKDLFDVSEFKDLVKTLGFKPVTSTEKSKKLSSKRLSKETLISKSKEKNKEKKKKKTKQPVQDNAISSSSDATATKELDIQAAKNTEKLIKLLPDMPTKTILTHTVIWHEVLHDESENKSEQLDKPTTAILRQYAEGLLSNEIQLHQSKHSKNDNSSKGNTSWVKTVSTAGTLSDKVSALTLMVQEDFIHNISSLESLLSMMKKKGRREAIMALEAIRDLMLGDLLPSNRRLNLFNQQQLSNVLGTFEAGKSTNKLSIEVCQKKLLIWIFEDKLKNIFKSFVEHLKIMAVDPLEASKTKAMSVAVSMLLNKPEQEKELLTLLVNKLGDPKYKIASKALHMLNSVVSEHPLMQAIIVREVRDLLLRPNLAARAQYYCVCFLSSQILTHDRKDVAKKLIQIYMSFFKSCVKTHKDDNKMLSALLTGVNRAFPYADLADQEIIDELDVLFKTVHVARISTTVQALVLLFQVFNSRNEVSDRFYNALYASLMHPELPVSTMRHPMFLNLIYRAVKADPCEPRIEAFVKRLLQICTLQQSPFTAAVFVLISELISVKPSLAYCFFGSKSSKNDDGLGESTKVSAHVNNDEDDEEEHFVDVKEDSDAEEGEKRKQSDVTSKKLSSWTHKHRERMRFGEGGYDPLHRNPQFAGAEKSSLWELHTYCKHFHPSVTLFSKNLLHQCPEPQSGDPLDDYTLMKFLDRFVYRNPKTKEPKKSKSGQPVQMMSAHRRKRHATFNTTVPVNSVAFLQQQKLSPEEVFFHRYFSSQAGLKPRGAKSSKEDGEGASDVASDVESVGDAEFEDFMRSSEGQKEIDQQLNFSDHVYKNKKSAAKRKSNDLDSESDDDDDDDEMAMSDGLDDEEFDMEGGGYGFNMEEGENDILAEAGAFEDEAATTKHRAVDNRAKRRRKDVEKFNLMLEENTHDKLDSITSSAVSNRDRASAKQLKWEKIQETREVVARKRQRKGKQPREGKGRRQNPRGPQKKFVGKARNHKRR